ncbi:hypothetical protein [Streptomyces macrosporus]|uniref:Lipoprotein n=1 Tax=Streptomyces macrosporus TaxID=44032 RepID=A0ABN3K1Q8_9ACTN
MRHTVRAAVRIAALIGSFALVAGCGGDGGDAPGEGARNGGKAPRTATGTLEELAARTRCEVVVQTDAAELRQGMCTTEDGRYVLATFATAEGRRDWLAEAKPYGGTYLVGGKWVAVGEPEVLEKLRGRLGGALESGASHTGDVGGDGGPGSEGAGHGGHRGHG